MTETLTFSNFETREQEFRKRLFNIIPRKYAGISNFWSDYTTNFQNTNYDEFVSMGFITSNPKDCIAFATPFHTINAAGITAFKSQKSINKCLDLFNLRDIKDQNIHTISGGESIRLALAKAYISAERVNSLIINSPFVWLNTQDWSYLNKVINKYNELDKNIVILELVGENDDSPIHYQPHISHSFKLEIKDLKINLSPIFTLENKVEEIAEISDVNFNLKSPCLLIGKNGSGKTLLAKALSKLTRNISGEAVIITNGKIGFSRMLFQDIPSQTLNRGFETIIKHSGLKEDNVTNIYEKLNTTFQNYFRAKNTEIPIFSIDKRIGFPSIIEIKFLLVAIRIISKPQLLIIDEPAWGLSKEVSFAFLLSIINVADEYNIPIMIITNRNWYNDLANSTITIMKTKGKKNIFTIKEVDNA